MVIKFIKLNSLLLPFSTAYLQLFLDSNLKCQINDQHLNLAHFVDARSTYHVFGDLVELRLKVLKRFRIEQFLVAT